jgi:hypothetical protein
MRVLITEILHKTMTLPKAFVIYWNLPEAEKEEDLALASLSSKKSCLEKTPN